MATQSAAARASENDAHAGEQSDDDVMECAAPPEAVKAKGSSSATSDVWLYFDRGARKGGTVPCKKCKKHLASKDDNTSGERLHSAAGATRIALISNSSSIARYEASLGPRIAVLWPGR